MNSRFFPSPPLVRTLSAAVFLALFAYCFVRFSGQPWPDWGSPYATEAPVISPLSPPTDTASPDGSSPGTSGDTSDKSLDQKIRWVVIDPGHGGMDGGTQGNGILEKNYALDISKHLKARLEELGIPVVMTRVDDTNIKLSERYAFANKRNCAAFVSIHLNYSTVPAVSGVETFFSSNKSTEAKVSARKRLEIPTSVQFEDNQSKLLAEAVQERICTSTGSNNRGIKDRQFLVTLNTTAPSVLIECGFLSHAGEATRLKNEKYREEIAAATAGGIAHFLQQTKTDPLYGIAFEDPKDDPRPPTDPTPTSGALAQSPEQPQ